MSSDAWATMSEMLVLTMNSPPAEQLRNTCAGVSKLRTWGKLVHVRETSEDRLGLVFDIHDSDADVGSDGDSRPQAGKKYG
jgi:hypothetical protein